MKSKKNANSGVEMLTAADRALSRETIRPQPGAPGRRMT